MKIQTPPLWLLAGALILAPAPFALAAAEPGTPDGAGSAEAVTAPSVSGAFRRAAVRAEGKESPLYAPDSALPEMRRGESRGAREESTRKSLATQPGCTICLGGTGSAAWIGSTGSFHVDTISNSRSSGTSGTLDLRIAFTSSYPVFGQTISYYTFSDWLTLGTLSAGFQFNNVNSGTVGVYPGAIPAGAYWMLLYLREYQGGGVYSYTDFMVMNNRVTCNGVACSTVATCVEDANTMCLVGGRYRITSHWKNQYAGGAQATLSKAKLTDYTGAFWVADAGTYEYMIRINTATDNGRAWIAIPTFTDVEFFIDVTDMVGGQTKTYHSNPGNRTLIYDPTYFVYP